jgi:hypothetical protein
MADTVGAVYVKVLSDSSGFKKQLEKDAKTAGGKAAVHFGKEFDEGVTKDLKNLNLDRTLGPQVQAWGRKYAESVATAVRNGSSRAFKLEDVISVDELKRLERQLGVPFETLANYLRVEIPKAAKTGFGGIAKENAKSLAKQRKQQAAYEKWKATTTARMLKMTARLNQKFTEEQRKKQEAYFRWQVKTQQAYDQQRRRGVTRVKPITDLLDSDAFTKSIEAMAQKFYTIMTPAMRRSLEDGQKVDWVMDEDIRRSLKQIAKDSNTTFSTVEKYWDRTIRNMVAKSKSLTSGGFFAGLADEIADADRLMQRFGASVDRTRNGLRRAGTGGFFDTLTNVMAGLIGLAFKFGKAMYDGMEMAADGLVKFGAFLVKVAAKAGKFGGVLAKVGGSLLKFATLLKNPIVMLTAVLGAFTAGIWLLVKFAGAAVTGLVDLAGVFGMLAAGIGAAVVASLALVPLLVSLGAGLAALFIGGMDAAKGIMAYQRAMAETDPKKRAKALKAYREELAKLGPQTRAAVLATNELIGSFANFRKQMSEKLFGAGIDGLASSIKAAKPLVDSLKRGMLGVADAVGDVLDKFLRLGENNRFMQDFNYLWGQAGRMVRNVGYALVNLFSGLTSFFAVIAPYATRLSEKILEISERFLLWSQSDEGREKLKTFFADAWNLAKQLWDVLASLTGVVAAFFGAIIGGPEGAEAGGFLKSIADWLDRLKAKIEELDRNGKLKEWFQRAKETAEKLWNTLKTVGRELARLNTPENREFLRQLIVWFGRLVTAARIAFNIIKTGIRAAFLPFNAVAAVIRGIISLVKSLVGWLGRIKWPKPPAWVSKVGTVIFASGGIAAGPTRAIIGEAGPEAVIPLTRPLAQIDPSVRGMAAMLRGQGNAPAAAVTAAPGRQMNNYWTINTPTPDARVVASQVINRMAAMAS